MPTRPSFSDISRFCDGVSAAFRETPARAVAPTGTPVPAGRRQAVDIGRIVAAVIAWLACLPLVATAATYDLTTGFSATSNPTGV